MPRPASSYPFTTAALSGYVSPYEGDHTRPRSKVAELFERTPEGPSGPPELRRVAHAVILCAYWDLSRPCSKADRESALALLTDPTAPWWALAGLRPPASEALAPGALIRAHAARRLLGEGVRS